MPKTTKPLCLAAILVLCACADKTADQPGGESAAAAPNQQQLDQDVAAVADYRLSMDKFDKYLQAQKNIALATKDMTPEQREAMEMSSSSDASVDEMVQSIEANRVASDGIRKAGMSAREYVLFTVAYFSSAMAMTALQMRPNDNQDSLAREMKANMDNVRFVRDNMAELERKQQALTNELRSLGLTED